MYALYNNVMFEHAQGVVTECSDSALGRVFKYCTWVAHETCTVILLSKIYIPIKELIIY